MGLYFVSFDLPDITIPGQGTFSLDRGTSDTKFVLGFGGGYEKGPWEAFLRFVVIDPDVMNLGVTVAYNFPLN